MRPLGAWLAPPRFLAFLAALGVGLAALVGPLGWTRGAMVAFDGAAVLFLLSVAPLLRHHSAEELRAHARANDANRAILLLIVALTMTAVLAAITSELGGKPSTLAKALIVGTLALAWLFSNSVYALHYAHLHYNEGSKGGLKFSGGGDPDYADCVYFAFTLGMTFQTSDTEVTTPEMRRAVTLHSLAAFAFNIGVVAFTVNVLGGN